MLLSGSVASARAGQRTAHMREHAAMASHLVVRARTTCGAFRIHLDIMPISFLAGGKENSYNLLPTEATRTDMCLWPVPL